MLHTPTSPRHSNTKSYVVRRLLMLILTRDDGRNEQPAGCRAAYTRRLTYNVTSANGKLFMRDFCLEDDLSRSRVEVVTGSHWSAK